MNMLKALTLCLLLITGIAHATDRDIDNDGVWDYDKGGTDRDTDNDGSWDVSVRPTHLA